MDEQESEQGGRGGGPPVELPNTSEPVSKASEPAESAEADDGGNSPQEPHVPQEIKELPQSRAPHGSEEHKEPDEGSGSDGEVAADSVPRKRDGDEADAAASQVRHNNVTQYFLNALNAPEMHFGISLADSSNVLSRAVGRLDAGEADAVTAAYIKPDCFGEAARALQRDNVVVLVGPAGTGKRAAAVALVDEIAGGSEYVVLSPSRSLEDLANGRTVEFEEGVGYLQLDRMNEGPSVTTDFDWRRVRDAVRDHKAYLVVTTVHEVGARAPESVQHVPWQAPDLAAVLRVRLVRAGCTPETVERAVELMPAGSRIAEVVAAAERIGRGAEPEVVWSEYGSHAAAPVRGWFEEERSPQEWAEVTTLAFVTGAGYRDFETCQQRLEEWVARSFPEPADEEAAAEAARRAADRRLSLTRNILVAVEKRKNGSLTRTALVFPHPQYRLWVLQALWTTRATAYWDGVRDWLTELLRGGGCGLEMQLSIAQGLALLTPSAFDEVAENYLRPWASGAAGPIGQTTAALVLQCMCLDESLAAVALGVARDWARSNDPRLRSTATAAFSGALGVRFPTDAVQTLLRLTGRGRGRGAEAAFALAGLVAVLAECQQDTGAVFRPLAYRVRAQNYALAGHLKDGILDTTLTVLRARDARTGRPVCAEVLVRSPEQTEKIGELWAGVLGSLPRRTRALAGLVATLRALPAVCEGPEPVAARFGAAVGAALRPDERPGLRVGLESAAVRIESATSTHSSLTGIFLDAALSTED